MVNVAFGNTAVSELLDLFKDFHKKNGWDVEKASLEWDTQKTFIEPLVISKKLHIWKTGNVF